MKAATRKAKSNSHTGSSVFDRLTCAEAELYGQIEDDVDYVPHPSFARRTTEAELFGDDAEDVYVPHWTQFPEVPDDVQRSPRRRDRLSREDEALLFLRYNYARFRLAKLIRAQSRRKSLTRARKMVMWYRRALEARAALVRGNMALVLAMAKRTRIPNVEFGELVSEGNMALLRSVEKFDVARGYKFSTYACRAILKSFNRLATKTGRYRQRFPTEFDPDLERSDYDVHKHEMQHEDSVDALREILVRNRANLSRVEQTIVRERFAIGAGKAGEPAPKGRTLAEVGKMVGLTNERVRQIQNLALDKIRICLDEEYLGV